MLVSSGDCDVESIENHRGREEGLVVYPVYSRRSQGLSIGVNLYPDKKYCNFNCRYCEVFPFSNSVSFSLDSMERGLRKAIVYAASRNIPVRDICFSGNGEPTLSRDFAEALRLVSDLRDSLLKNDGVDIVVISNGTGLLREDCFNLLQDCARPPVLLKLWLKLDAGGADWYKKMDDCAVDFELLTGALKKFARQNECVIQTMHCSVNGAAPSVEEIRAWAGLTAEIASYGNTRLVQIYGKARPSPSDPVCAALPLVSLEERAGFLKSAFASAGVVNTPIVVYE
ncbi:MAG: radical SAM protein [Spirochaetaceae bacterium]|jgi:histidinol dehydrogenase|nr:radical SAM protein [Spirochaetaceae bacterium]